MRRLIFFFFEYVRIFLVHIVTWKFSLKVGPSYGIDVYSVAYGHGDEAVELFDFNAAAAHPHDRFVG